MAECKILLYILEIILFLKNIWYSYLDFKKYIDSVLAGGMGKPSGRGIAKRTDSGYDFYLFVGGESMRWG